MKKKKKPSRKPKKLKKKHVRNRKKKRFSELFIQMAPSKRQESRQPLTPYYQWVYDTLIEWHQKERHTKELCTGPTDPFNSEPAKTYRIIDNKGDEEE